MPTTEQTVRVYRELAEAYERQGQAQLRDRYLVLAADAALTGGREFEAESLRDRLLHQNPHHLLKPYATFAEALRSTDVLNYVTALRRSHPYEKALGLLESLRPGPGFEDRSKPKVLPTTNSMYDIEVEPREEPAEVASDLKVYRVRAEPEVPPEPPRMPAASAKPRPVAASLPEAPPRMPSPLAAPPSPRPLESRDIYPLRPDPEDILRHPRSDEEADDADLRGGYWVSTGLFLVVLALGLSVTGWSLVRPLFWH